MKCPNYANLRQSKNEAILKREARLKNRNKKAALAEFRETGKWPKK